MKYDTIKFEQNTVILWWILKPYLVQWPDTFFFHLVFVYAFINLPLQVSIFIFPRWHACVSCVECFSPSSWQEFSILTKICGLLPLPLFKLISHYPHVLLFLTSTLPHISLALDRTTASTLIIVTLPAKYGKDTETDKEKHKAPRHTCEFETMVSWPDIPKQRKRYPLLDVIMGYLKLTLSLISLCFGITCITFILPLSLDTI